jgi:ribulose-5-phosphate 4-epimerase/fuculose-1-phosphate aldolase
MNENEAREEIAKYARSLFERGFVVGSAGNISARIDGGFLVTPTNSCLGFLDPHRISKLDSSWTHISGDAPSKEVLLHRAFYDSREDAGAVVHLHSTFATALSCLSDINPGNTIPALTPYMVMRVGEVPLIEYVPPGDPRMGDLIRALEGKYRAVLLANHGPVVSGQDLHSAVYAAEELEETAKLTFMLNGRDPRTLDDDRICDLRSRFPF